MTSRVRRYHRHYRSHSHVGQGRFKSFPMQQDSHLLTVLRYVLRNPVRAELVKHARALALVEPAIPASERPRSHRGADRVASVDQSTAR